MQQMDRISLGRRQALEDGRMFRVHRIDGGFATGGFLHYQGTCGHQGFLVGQGDGLAGPDGRQGGTQAAEAYHRRHHHIHLRSLYQVAGGLDAQIYVDIGRKGIPHLLILGGITDDHVRNMEGKGLLHQQLRAGIGAEHEHGKTVRVLTHHIQCLCADRARRAQYSDGFCHSMVFVIQSAVEESRI